MAHRAFIVGAGNVGRGFLGQVFSESGYQVVFVDVDRPLVEALRSRGTYTIRLVDNAGRKDVLVGPVSGLLASEAEDVAEAIAGAALGATAVGARALPAIAPLLAEGIRRRDERGTAEPLNIVVCENLVHAAETLKGLVAGYLPPAVRDYMDERVGFVDTVIGRMIPELPPELRADDPSLIIAEPYKVLPVDRAGFRGAVPRIAGLEAADNFGVYTARKLYLHNAGHAVLGYLGHRKGIALGYLALEDPDIRPILDAALDEALRGIVSRYGADDHWLRDHVADLITRFANRALADPITRLARDPLRKLAPDDRLVGAARVAEYAGIVPVHLAWGIAAALAYDACTDPRALELQGRIAAEGVERVLADLCAIRPTEPLGTAVLVRYRLLCGGGAWA